MVHGIAQLIAPTSADFETAAGAYAGRWWQGHVTDGTAVNIRIRAHTLHAWAADPADPN
jgi:hypothetical protein